MLANLDGFTVKKDPTTDNKVSKRTLMMTLINLRFLDLTEISKTI